MLALKKKKEQEAKLAAEAPPAEGKISLLGIGGVKQTNGGGEATTGKKRTPGEIRIQKGEPYNGTCNRVNIADCLLLVCCIELCSCRCDMLLLYSSLLTSFFLLLSCSLSVSTRYIVSYILICPLLHLHL
jgi:hypothetical protein